VFFTGIETFEQEHRRGAEGRIVSDDAFASVIFL
jgi:hypothetical protein